jgi:glutamate formiminotransferase/glutamate formiminotransferase/formiminotetrahydrofolate cyclodeaminase
MRALESVPNVSEGRDPAVVEAIENAFSSAGAHLLDVHVDPDHHRSVVTLVGDDRALEGGLVAGIDEARRRIDLRRHTGVHPRVGAADVVPIVPLERADLPRAVAVARAVGRRVGDELGLPVFLYGALAEGRRPAFYRRGGPTTLQARVDDGELRPAYGPRRLDPAAGAVLVGVRAPLLAFNLEVVGGSFEAVAALAAVVRESSGGLPGVQALALELDGGVQLSTNVIDLDATPPHVLVERVLEEAVARGIDVGAGELVGLIPAASVAEAAAAAGVVDRVDAGSLPTPAALAAAARALRLEQLEPDRVLEWHLR